jgi:hypothetical protein
VVLDYSTTLGRILSIIIIAVVIAVIIQNRDKIKGILKSIGKNLIHIMGTFILGLIISFGLATASGVNFTLNHMGKVPGDDILVIVLPIILLGFILKIEMKKKDNISENFITGVLIQTILLIVTMVFLPGASYVAMIPLMLIIISLLINIINKDVAKYTLLLTIAAMIILYIPLINIFHMAFSIGSLPLIFVIVMIMKSLILPTINKIVD